MPGIKQLADNVAVVTGAGSGIGRATAHALAAEKARLVIVDINEERLETVVNEITASGAQAVGKKVDVSDNAQVEDLARYTLETYGRVDILHNNAGIGQGGPAENGGLL